jgi:sugar lactone lactonase YvrE
MAAIREIVVFNMGEITNAGNCAGTAGTAYAGVNVTLAELNQKAVVGTIQLAAFDSRVSDNSAFGMTVDKSGNIYISDYSANMVYKMTEGGKINHLAGRGGATGNNSSKQKVAGTAALFYNPSGITCDNSGNIYVADKGNNQIRKITDGYVSVLAGNGATASGLVDATANPLQAQFSAPLDVAVDNSGNVFVADSSNYAIRKITGGRVLNICGGTQATVGADLQNVKASNIVGSRNYFNTMTSIAVNANGDLFVSDSALRNIKKITPNGWVYLFSGSEADGKSLGTAATSTVAARKAYTCEYNNPTMVRCARDGYVYVLDAGKDTSRTGYYSSRLVKLTPNGVPSNVVEFHDSSAEASQGVRAFAISPANRIFVAVIHT